MTPPAVGRIIFSFNTYGAAAAHLFFHKCFHLPPFALCVYLMLTFAAFCIMQGNNTAAVRAVFRFSPVTVQTSGTRFFMITMFVTNHAVHPTGCKHVCFNLLRHSHLPASLCFFSFQESGNNLCRLLGTGENCGMYPFRENTYFCIGFFGYCTIFILKI